MRRTDFTSSKIYNVFRADIQLYLHEWKLEKQEIEWKHKTGRAKIFQQLPIVFREF